MTIARSIFVLIVAVGLVVTLGRASLGRGEGHGGHESHGGAEHKSHHEEGHHSEHHEGHHEEHHGEHHEAHHEEGHHGEHHESHHGEHYGEHHGEHHDEHYGEHHGEHHDEHHDAHHEDRHDEHHADDEHHDDHRYEHRDDRHYDHHDARHEIDHKDWYRHEWWHHQLSWHDRPWQHWWHRPTTNEVLGWSAGLGLAAPLYYEYGPGGNVVYRNGEVYVDGGLVGTTDAYAKSAIALANASPATEAANDQAGEWLPLGTFAVLRPDGDTTPSQTLQLAMDKNGSISGVLFNLSEETSTPIHGSLDRATQRVAFGLGDGSGLVAETGIYNLTKDEVTLLVHKEGEKPQTYTLVRFDSPPTDTKDKEVALLLW